MTINKTICRLGLAVCAWSIITVGPALAADEYDARDPWERGLNRPTFGFNQAVDAVTTKPAAQLYDQAPAWISDRFTNFFANLEDVPTMLNNGLQGKVGRMGGDLMRVLLNSTVGLLGAFDVATQLGIEKHHEDFGQTLGTWGVASGPYIVVPLLGPRTVRDFPASVVDFFTHPATYFSPGARTIIWVGRVVDTRASLLDKEEVIYALSPDRYEAVRNYYLSRRDVQVRDGVVDEEVYDYDIPEEALLMEEVGGETAEVIYGDDVRYDAEPEPAVSQEQGPVAADKAPRQIPPDVMTAARKETL